MFFLEIIYKGGHIVLTSLKHVRLDATTPTIRCLVIFIEGRIILQRN